MRTVNRVFNIGGLTSDELITMTQATLDKNFNKLKCEFGKNMESRSFKCRIRTALFNPVVSLVGVISAKTGTEKSIISIDYNTTGNGWLAFTIILGLFFWPVWILAIWMWISQSKRSDQEMQSVLEKVEYEIESRNI